jgi:hypothetical protein
MILTRNVGDRIKDVASQHPELGKALLTARHGLGSARVQRVLDIVEEKGGAVVWQEFQAAKEAAVAIRNFDFYVMHICDESRSTRPVMMKG